MCMCILCATAKLFCLDARSADERREREREKEREYRREAFYYGGSFNRGAETFSKRAAGNGLIEGLLFGAKRISEPADCR